MREAARLNHAKRSDAHERAAKQQGRGHDPRKSRPKDARSHSRSLKRAGESKSLRVAHPICAEPPERDRRGRRESDQEPDEGLGAAHIFRCSDRKSTRLNSSHGYISYAVFCLKKKNWNVSNNSIFR